MKKKVVILGGGVGGLSAAHELVRRDFDVVVYEKLDIAGGKARSINIANSAAPNKKPLPGEHGFRFFPKFYQHITQTMKEIPYKEGTVFDNLVDTTRIDLLQYNKAPIKLISRFPKSLKDLEVIITLIFTQNSGLSKEEIHYFAKRIWQILTSCDERRFDELERTPWEEMLEASKFSSAYRKFLVEGLTRSLVAAQASKAASKTVGDILVQLFFDLLESGGSSDRLLNGPTNEVWINPWLKYLQDLGVQYNFNHRVSSIKMQGDSIESISISHLDEVLQIEADYFIFAIPVDRFAPLITDDMIKVDPTLKSIIPLSKNVAWMNGVQFYLNKDIKISHGHSIFVDTPWALTSVSQAQFWDDFPMDSFGDGTIKGIISVDISQWEAKGTFNNKKASQCSKEEIIKEVWLQMKESLAKDCEDKLEDDYLVSTFLDPAIIIQEGKETINDEPLLINVINSWHQRPNDYTRIHNLLFASDYVKTNTDLATMEGANEAAKRAVNTILYKSKSSKPYCKIYKLRMPFFFKIYRWFDQLGYNKGLPWKGRIF